MPDTIIELNDCQIFQEDHPVLRDVDLCLDVGEFAYLIGKTGSGKSSLLQTLYGQLPLRGGTAKVAGKNLSELDWVSIAGLRRKLGIVFQDFSLLTDRTVDANLRFVLRATGWTDGAEMDARIKEVLTAVGLDGKGDRLPHQLSGGEQQRVAVARALLNKPAVILADEPTGNLDPDTADDIIRLIRAVALHEGAATLFATHNYQLIEKYPARIIRCLDGELVEEHHEEGEGE